MEILILVTCCAAWIGLAALMKYLARHLGRQISLDQGEGILVALLFLAMWLQPLPPIKVM